MTSALLPGAEPYAADGGRTGVLLSHGFTGSPASMTPWAQHLAGRGHTVRVPRLPGHGTTWQDMNTTRWQDWYSEVDTALTELQRTCDRVVVAGLSMGGCLALRLAEQRPDDVAALVLVNPAVSVKRFDVKLVPALQLVIPSMPGIGNDIKKPGQDEVGYDRTPLKALASQLKMWRDVRSGLDRVTAPLLFFRSEDDHVVDETSQTIILDGVSSPVKKLVTLRDSFHVATLDHDAPLIFDRSAAFIDEHVGAGRG
ncbi:alpha/beta hydrolase [Aeromicrobium chenweiae]|uniref:Esterase n=1 Tax=Aeromicrobium chenweiae TaxID=2079793 RepID=A0A2S0WL17_9ACTN|nr:alpha/beta fold hydrolase [Aeromicrobium chenweiae]AWB91972.1 esterase [Aeromicrobium chenweiae]TGN32823.1 alpha/beta fold hydrolase [Aeromicrobium chenweiae]